VTAPIKRRFDENDGGALRPRPDTNLLRGGVMCTFCNSGSSDPSLNGFVQRVFCWRAAPVLGAGAVISIKLFDVPDNLFLLAHLRVGTVTSFIRIWPPESSGFPLTTAHFKETHVDRTA
jgi:hypothetical protein